MKKRFESEYLISHRNKIKKYLGEDLVIERKNLDILSLDGILIPSLDLIKTNDYITNHSVNLIEPDNVIRTGNILSGVYIINGKYVGQSTHIRKRIKQHIQSSLNGRHYNSKLQSDILNSIYKNTLSIEIVSYDINMEYFFVKKLLDDGIDVLNGKQGLEKNTLGYDLYKSFSNNYCI